MTNFPKSPLFLLLLAAPLMLGSPATRAAEGIFPGVGSPVLAQTAEERKAEADRLFELGKQQYQVSQFLEALQSWEAALQIYREIGVREAFPQESRNGEVHSLGGVGIAYDSLGQYERAIDFYEQSLALAREIGNPSGEANSLGNLGLAYYNLGQYERALDFYEQSLALAREIGNSNGEASSLNNLGNVYDSLGQYERALDFHQQSLALAREIDDPSGEADSLGNLGITYYNLGQYERALDFQQQSLAIKREIGDPSGEASSLNSLGNVYSSLGQYERAIDFYQLALAIRQEIDDRNGKTSSLQGLGIAYRNLGQYERALNVYEQSLALFQEIGNPNGEASSRANLGDVYNSLGQYERAIEFYEQSLAIHQEIGNPSGKASSLQGLGIAYNSLGQYPKATEALFTSLEIYESLRYEELPDEEKIAFYDAQFRPYRILQRSLIAQGEIEQALEISERGRTRAFVSLLAQKRGLNSADEPLPPPSIAQIQQLAREENVTLVQYSDVSFSDDENPKLFAWVIQPTGTLHFREIDLDSLNDSLSDFIATTRETADLRESRSATVPDKIRNANAPYKIREDYLEQRRAQTDRQLSQLHDLLITPIADLLPTNPEDPIIFIPHRSLFLVPFPALLNADGEYLIQNHTILTAPSIQVLELSRRGRRGDGERFWW